MTLKKISLILAILAVIIPAGYTAYAFVDGTLTHIARAERKWLNDELTATQMRLWALEERFRTWDLPAEIKTELDILRLKIEDLRRQLQAKG